MTRIAYSSILSKTPKNCEGYPYSSGIRRISKTSSKCSVFTWDGRYSSCSASDSSPSRNSNFAILSLFNQNPGWYSTVILGGSASLSIPMSLTSYNSTWISGQILIRQIYTVYTFHPDISGAPWGESTSVWRTAISIGTPFLNDRIKIYLYR